MKRLFLFLSGTLAQSRGSRQVVIPVPIYYSRPIYVPVPVPQFYPVDLSPPQALVQAIRQRLPNRTRNRTTQSQGDNGPSRSVQSYQDDTDDGNYFVKGADASFGQGMLLDNEGILSGTDLGLAIQILSVVGPGAKDRVVEENDNEMNILRTSKQSANSDGQQELEEEGTPLDVHRVARGDQQLQIAPLLADK